jgi:glycosyltransferase involved in cell wall biosynthesis
MIKRSNTIRICIVAASLDILGGQAVQAARLLEGLSGERQIEAGFLPINPRLPRALRFLQRIKYVRTAVTMLLYTALLLVRLPRYDVVHVFSAAYLSFLLAPLPAMLIARLYGKPVLLNYHSGEAKDHLRRWGRIATAGIRLANRVVVPSEFLVEAFAEFGVRAEAVANTVDTSRFKFHERSRLRPVFLSNRNLEPMYGVDCTLRALKLVQEQLPEARLIVAGDGSQRERLHALASGLGLRQVEFLGRVAPERMPQLYDEADIFINASEIDNMPLSIIEAFAAGLPVVTTDAGGIPCLVSNERTGLIVRQGDHLALARAALRLLNDHNLAREMIATARAECHRYTWEAVRGQWLRHYQELARANTRCESPQIAGGIDCGNYYQ